MQRIRTTKTRHLRVGETISVMHVSTFVSLFFRTLLADNFNFDLECFHSVFSSGNCSDHVIFRTDHGKLAISGRLPAIILHSMKNSIKIL